jgi:hypothetical protein
MNMPEPPKVAIRKDNGFEMSVIARLDRAIQ